MTPLARYQEDLKRPDFLHDAAQETAVRHLQRLYDDLVAAHKRKPGLLGSLFAKKAQEPVKGLYFWGGIAGTTCFVDPAKDFFALMMIQAPNQRDYYRPLFRNVVYAALLE